MEKLTFSSEAELKKNFSNKGETPRRLRYALGAWVETSLGKIDIVGLEHLQEIPKDKKVIIATSHVSDLDVPTATYKLGKYFNIIIADQSVHHKFAQEASTNMGLRLTGEKNYLPLDYVIREGKKEARFNPENFVPMQEAMEQGKTLVMAAHNPSQSGLKIESGGIGSIYLAQLTDAVILPVAVNLKTNEPLGMEGKELQTMLERPDAEVNIGTPMVLKKIENIEFIKQAMNKRKSGEKLSKEEINEFSSIIDQLRVQSNEVLSKIAQMLPESKRGEY